MIEMLVHTYIQAFASKTVFLIIAQYSVLSCPVT